MTKDKALKMAIEAMTLPNNFSFLMAITACKEALEQPAQEPVAWMNDIAFSMDKDELTADKFGDIVPLYTHPAPSWQGLSNDMVRAIGEKCEEENRGILNWIDFYNAIESMLKEKNYEQH